MFKFVLKFILILLFLLITVWAALTALLSTKKGQEWIIANSITYLERATGLGLHPEKIEWILPFGIRMHNLTISSGEDKLTAIEEIDLFCLYPALLHGRLICSSLHAKGITLFSSGKRSSSTPVSKLLPFYLKIENIHLEQIRLSPALLKKEVIPLRALNQELERFSFNLQGMISNNPLKHSITAHLLLTATHLARTSSPITLGINAQNNLLSFSLHADQWLIPETNLKSNLAFFASGTFNSWQQIAKQSPFTDLPIEGHFKWTIPSEHVFIKSRYQIHSAAEMNLFETILKAPRLDVHGQARLSLDGIQQGSFDGKYIEADQEIALQGTVAGPYDQLAIKANVDAPRFNLGKYPLEKIRSSLEATIQGKQAEGLIRLDFESNRVPCRLESAFQWDKANEKLHFPHLAIDALQSHLKGSLSVDTSDLIFEGDLEAYATQLEPIAKLADLSIEGETDFKLSFKRVQDEGSAELQGIGCDLVGKEIRWNQLYIGRLALRSEYPSGSIHFSIKQAKNGLMEIHDLSGESALSTSQKEWPFKLSGSGQFEEQWDLDARGSWHFDLQALFTSSVRISVSREGSDALVFDEGIAPAISEEKNRADDSLVGDRKLTDEVNKADQHIVEFHLSELKGFYGSSPLELLLPLDFIYSTDQRARGSVGLRWGDSEIKATYTSEQGNFNLDIEGEGRLDAYLHHFVQDAPNLSGEAKVALKITEDRDKPSIRGHLEIFNATYESQDTGAIYHNIRAHLVGGGSKILLKSLVAEDSQGGTISGDGSIQINPDLNFPFEFHIQAAKLYILNSDYAAISASGPLSLTGDTKKAKLSGNLKVEKAVVHLEEALPKQIKTVDIHYINLPEGLEAPIAAKEAGLEMELDINLAAQEILIEGNHLKSTWKGELTIEGTTNQPLLFGDLRVSKGEYDLNSKVFSLKQGSIHFAGAADKKTTLYVVASKEIDPIKAEMIVKGPLNKLEVSFRSNPPLSQREVLSYILFGKGVSEITTGEGNTLNQSFISLNTSEQTSQKQDLLTRLRNNIGIDRLDFTAAGEGENQDVALQVGKYVWDDLFISINKSIGASADRIAIEAKLMKNVKAQAEVEIGSSSQGKVSLKWKRDY
jgi:autotransporter translocation and assembly factor TamB